MDDVERYWRVAADQGCRNIRKFREKAGWSIDRCGNLIGVNPDFLDRIEHQAIEFTPRTWEWLDLITNQIIELSYAEQRFARVDGSRDSDTEAVRLRNVIERAQDVLDEASYQTRPVR